MHLSTTPLPLLATLALSTAVVAQPGTLDPSFNTTGIKILQPGAVHDVGYSVVALPDTTLLVCGVTSVSGVNSCFVGHLLQDGSLDAGWGTSSGYTFITAGLESYAYDMAVDPNGNIFLCGTVYITFAQSEILLVKLLADGTPDASFGTNGVIHMPIGSGDAIANSIVIQPADGKLVLGGSAGPFGAYDALVMRCLADGTPDALFSGDGITTATALATEDLLQAVDILADGSIVGAGWGDVIGDMKTVLVRVDMNGNFMSSFGGDGFVVPGYGVTTDRAFGVKASGQQFYVCGSYADDPNNANTYLARFNDDGVLDGSFGTGGWTDTDTDENEVALDVDQQADGKLLICGTTGEFGFGTPRDLLVARFSDAGVLDPGFGTGGVTITSIDVDFDDANALAVQPDGKVVCAGFTSGFTAGTANDAVVVRYLGDVTTGLGEGSTTTSSYAFPNPVEDHATLGVTGFSNKHAIRCADMNGQEVPVRRIRTDAQEVHLAIDHLAPGAYLLTDGDGRQVRFMKR